MVSSPLRETEKRPDCEGGWLGKSRIWRQNGKKKKELVSHQSRVSLLNLCCYNLDVIQVFPLKDTTVAVGSARTKCYNQRPATPQVKTRFILTRRSISQHVNAESARGGGHLRREQCNQSSVYRGRSPAFDMSHSGGRSPLLRRLRKIGTGASSSL